MDPTAVPAVPKEAAARNTDRHRGQSPHHACFRQSRLCPPCRRRAGRGRRRADEGRAHLRRAGHPDQVPREHPARAQARRDRAKPARAGRRLCACASRQRDQPRGRDPRRRRAARERPWRSTGERQLSRPGGQARPTSGSRSVPASGTCWSGRHSPISARASCPKTSRSWRRTPRRGSRWAAFEEPPRADARRPDTRRPDAERPAARPFRINRRSSADTLPERTAPPGDTRGRKVSHSVRSRQENPPGPGRGCVTERCCRSLRGTPVRQIRSRLRRQPGRWPGRRPCRGQPGRSGCRRRPAAGCPR